MTNDDAPGLPPIVATVQAGDALIFLVPGMERWSPKTYQIWREVMELRHPDIKCTFVPAVGVVVQAAPPLQMVDLPPGRLARQDRCTAHAISGSDLRLCNLAPGHPSYEHEDSLGKWIQPPEA